LPVPTCPGTLAVLSARFVRLASSLGEVRTDRPDVSGGGTSGAGATKPELLPNLAQVYVPGIEIANEAWKSGRVHMSAEFQPPWKSWRT
jgi:hypothetical protein